MKRNPINIFHDTINKASTLVELAIRSAIHSKRAKKLRKIDLRKYKGNPDKKEQIRKLYIAEINKVSAFMVQMMIIASQPIQTKVFEKGAIEL